MWHRCILFLHSSIMTIEAIDYKIPVQVQINFFSFCYGEVMQYFHLMPFFCYKNENIRHLKHPISTRQAKKVTPACYACLCLTYCCPKSLLRSYYGKNPYVGTAVHHNMMYAIFLHELAIPYSL